MAVGSFLESYDLTGKAIVPFCTSQDNGIDVSMDYIREVSGNATVLEGYRIHNSSMEDVSAWLERIGALEQAGETNNSGSISSNTDNINIALEASELGYVTEGIDTYRDFLIDNVFHSASEGDIH